MKNTILSLGILLTCTVQAQNALDFDGVDDIVTTAYAGISGTNARTIEAWINTSTVIADQHVIADYGYFGTSSFDNGKRFTFGLNATHQLRLEVRGWGLNGTTALNDGNWHHVAATYDGTTVRVYVDGVEEANGTPSVTVNTTLTTSFQIGARIDGAKFFVGSIDELRFWNVVRTPAELSAFSGTEYCTAPSALKAYYQFNEGTAGDDNTGLSTTQEMAASNNGTLTNFALTGAASNWVNGASLTNGTSSLQSFTICAGESVTVGSNTYTSSGNYTDVFTSAVTGCDSTIVTNLTVIPSSAFTQSFTECEGFSVTVGGNTYTTSGTYTDTLTSLLTGCDSIVTTNLTIDAVTAATSVSGITITADPAGATYTWVDCDNGNASIPGETAQTFTPAANGNYAVIVSNGSCSDTSDCVAITTVGIESLDAVVCSLYPNPVNDVLHVTAAQGLSFELRVWNLAGEKVAEYRTVTGTLEVNVRDLPQGAYISEVVVEDGNCSFQRFVKQ